MTEGRGDGKGEGKMHGEEKKKGERRRDGQHNEEIVEEGHKCEPISWGEGKKNSSRTERHTHTKEINGSCHPDWL